MIWRILRRLLADRRGASAVEFALVAGPFAMLMFGTVEFGRIYWSKQALDEVAIIGARCVAIPQSSCARNGVYDQAASVQAIRDAARWNGVPLDASRIGVRRGGNCAGLSGFAVVSLTYDFQSPIEALLEPILGTMTLRASACFPIQ